MKDRLETLRQRLGIQWKDLAKALSISVPMLGCLRRGERNPSKKVLDRLVELEKNGLQSSSSSTTKDSGVSEWMQRALLAEARLAEIQKEVDKIKDILAKNS